MKIVGGKIKSSYWEEQLNGKVVHLKGNHNKSSGVPSITVQMVMEFGSKVFLARHYPLALEDIMSCRNKIDGVLCGHVHEKWKYDYIGDHVVGRIPMINVGVDVWNFKPVKLNEILAYYEKTLKREGQK